MGYRQFPALQAKQIKVTQLFAIRALLWLSMAPLFHSTISTISTEKQLKSKSEKCEWALLEFRNDYTSAAAYVFFASCDGKVSLHIPPYILDIWLDASGICRLIQQRMHRLKPVC